MKEKTKKVKNKKKIIIGIIFALISLYLIYAVYLLIKQPTDKVTVENGTLYLEETDVGYIIRDEKVVKGNNYKNGMEQIKTEGEKTAKGESIYRYYSKNESDLTKQIAELDTKIQEALEGQTNLYTSDIKLKYIILLFYTLVYNRKILIFKYSLSSKHIVSILYLFQTII